MTRYEPAPVRGRTGNSALRHGENGPTCAALPRRPDASARAATSLWTFVLRDDRRRRSPVHAAYAATRRRTRRTALGCVDPLRRSPAPDRRRPAHRLRRIRYKLSFRDIAELPTQSMRPGSCWRWPRAPELRREPRSASEPARGRGQPRQGAGEQVDHEHVNTERRGGCHVGRR